MAKPQAGISPFSLAIAIAGFIAIITFILVHEAPAALPQAIPPDIQRYEQLDAKIGATDSLKDIVNMFFGLSLALTAVVGFIIKEGLGSYCIQRGINMVLISIYGYFLVRVIVYAYDIYGMIAIQLEFGYLFSSRIQGLIVIQARSVLICTILAVSLANIRLTDIGVEGCKCSLNYFSSRGGAQFVRLLTMLRQTLTTSLIS